VLDYAEAMTDTARRVTPAQIGALKGHFDDDGVVALTAWIAFQNLSAKFNNALGAEDNGLCKLPGKVAGISLSRGTRACV
jgi:alkylhydroperoxidase family enzyme